MYKRQGGFVFGDRLLGGGGVAVVLLTTQPERVDGVRRLFGQRLRQGGGVVVADPAEGGVQDVEQ